MGERNEGHQYVILWRLYISRRVEFNEVVARVKGGIHRGTFLKDRKYCDLYDYVNKA